MPFSNEKTNSICELRFFFYCRFHHGKDVIFSSHSRNNIVSRKKRRNEDNVSTHIFDIQNDNLSSINSVINLIENKIQRVNGRF